jgi:NADP-dependent 3-hydroxy acid dehydrogenase YdfG
MVLSGDIRSAADLDARITNVLRQWGRLDFVVANAGLGKQGSVLDGNTGRWREVVMTNLLGTALTVRAALWYFRHVGAGQVVIVGTIAGRGAGQVVIVGSIAGREAYEGEARRSSPGCRPSSHYRSTTWPGRSPSPSRVQHMSSSMRAPCGRYGKWYKQTCPI